MTDSTGAADWYSDLWHKPPEIDLRFDEDSETLLEAYAREHVRWLRKLAKTIIKKQEPEAASVPAAAVADAFATIVYWIGIAQWAALSQNDRRWDDLFRAFNSLAPSSISDWAEGDGSKSGPAS